MGFDIIINNHHAPRSFGIISPISPVVSARYDQTPWIEESAHISEWQNREQCGDHRDHIEPRAETPLESLHDIELKVVAID
jgi:hypothetical protein